MVQIVSAPSETTEPEVPAPAATPAGSPRRMSVLDRIREEAGEARENRYIDLALPDNVPGNLALRVGVPRQAFGSMADDYSGTVDLLVDINEISQNVLGISQYENGGWALVDDLTVHDVAVAYGTALRGKAPDLPDDSAAVRELYMSGTPPQIEPHALSVTARTYRAWALDPTLGRSSAHLTTS